MRRSQRTWLFSRRAQLIGGAPDVEVTPPPTMCGPCANVYEKIGDRASATTEYRRFLELWPQADPDLPQVRQAKQRLGRD